MYVSQVYLILSLKELMIMTEMSQIENYIQNQLSVQEIDALWTEFLKSPALYDYYSTAINLQALFPKTKDDIAF